jgi:hypothetical protein
LIHTGLFAGDVKLKTKTALIALGIALSLGHSPVWAFESDDTELSSQKSSGDATPAYTIANPPAHQYITQQGVLLNGVSDATRNYAYRDIYSPLDAIFTAKYDWDDDLIVASGEEDKEKNPLLASLEEIGCIYPSVAFIERICSNGGRNGFFEHFFNPDKITAGVYYNGATESGLYNQGLVVSVFPLVNPPQGNYDSAFRLAEDYHVNYVLPLILGGDWDEGYYWFGREIHLIEDMAIPAHVHLVAHDQIHGSDPYEAFFQRRPDILFGQTAASVANKAYRVSNLPNMNGFNWSCVFPEASIGRNSSDLFKLFWYTAQKTQYSGVRTDRVQQLGNSVYRCTDGTAHKFVPSLWAGEQVTPLGKPENLADDAGLTRTANALLPHAFRAVAGLSILLQEDLNRYTLSWWDSGVLPVGAWTTVRHNLSVSASLEVGKVRQSGGPAMTIKEAVSAGLLENSAQDFYQGNWRTFKTDLDEWRFLPNRSYRVKALKPGVKIFLRAVEDYPRTTSFFRPLPKSLF